jgi:hypothetical protein
VTATLAPLLAVVVIVAIDIWVYLDAKRCADEGAPVVLRIGGLVVITPTAWLLGCLIVWIFFFPMYTERPALDGKQSRSGTVRRPVGPGKPTHTPRGVCCRAEYAATRC